MATRITPQGGDRSSAEGIDLSRNRSLFDKFNRQRFQNVYTVFPDNYYLIFKIVPFLLHTNFRGLPGFVDHPETPHGIKFHTPDEDAVLYVDRYFSKKVKLAQKDDRSEGFIEFLSVMGSVGSVAQTRNSDFDMWVGIHRDAVDDESYRRFLQKLRAIEEWLETLRLEVHFFPTDIKSVKNNVFGAVDDESCGSAQALMLKDEYYRTAILIAGKIPYWWMVEPGATDEDYDRFHEKCLEGNGAFSKDYIDIGNVGQINKGEFFGAALWQLVKSLRYPFKSFIKMCLIEKYLFSDSDNHVVLLSNTLKENILQKECLDTACTDGYLLMFKSVEDFFLSRDKQRELDLLRTCFYMKVEANLSGLSRNVRAGSQKLILMDQRVKSWGWDSSRIRRLDSFHLWPMDDILKFDHELKVYMIQSFSQLSKSHESFSDSNLLTENDLTVITRKLMSYYLPKPKKVRNFCFTFGESVFESELNIARENDGWKLYRGEAVRDKHQLKFSNLLYSGTHLTDLCLWIANSKIFNPNHTKLGVFFTDSNISSSDLSKLITAMADPFLSHSSAKSKHYLEEPFIQRAFFTCRLDLSDAIDQFSVFYMNSWGEVFAEHFTSETEMEPLICALLSGYIRQGRPNPIQFLTFHSVAGGMKELLAFKGRLMDMLSAFRPLRPERSVGIFLAARSGEHVGYAALGSDVRCFRHPSLYGLLALIRREIQSDLPRSYLFDAELAHSGYFAPAANHFRNGEFDVFAGAVNGAHAVVFVSDDLNRVTAGLVPILSRDRELRGIRSFVSAIDPKRKINFYDITETNGKVAVAPMNPDRFANATGGDVAVARVKAVQKSEFPDPAAGDLSHFTIETDTGLIDPSDARQRTAWIAAARHAGAAAFEVTHVILDKSSALPAGALLNIKLTLQKTLNAALAKG